MKRFKVWLLLVLVFLAGFAGGMVVTRGMVRHFVRNAIANPDVVRNRIERDINRKLRLDARQRKEVHQILVESHRQIRDLRQNYQPQLNDIFSNTKKDIAAVLTPEQREQFEKIVAENRAVLRMQ